MKLKLDLDALQVDTFATDETPSVRGTVRGHETVVSCPGYTCDACVYTLVCATQNVGQCGGGGQSGVATCNCPTEANCAYPTTSCGDTQTYGEHTCNCLYVRTDVRICCDGPSGAGAMC